MEVNYCVYSETTILTWRGLSPYHPMLTAPIIRDPALARRDIQGLPSERLFYPTIQSPFRISLGKRQRNMNPAVLSASAITGGTGEPTAS